MALRKRICESRDPGPHQDREGLRADFEVEAAAIAGDGLVEAGAVIGDDARENVEPAGRAFRVRDAGHVRGQRQRLLDLGDINAADFQNRAGAEIHGVKHEPLDLLSRRGGRPRHEARTHPERARPEPKIEARGLDLPGPDRSGGRDRASLDQRRDRLRWKNAKSRHGSGIGDVGAAEQLIFLEPCGKRRKSRSTIGTSTDRVVVIPEGRSPDPGIVTH